MYRTHRVQTHEINRSFFGVQILWEHAAVGFLFGQEPYNLNMKFSFCHREHPPKDFLWRGKVSISHKSVVKLFLFTNSCYLSLVGKVLLLTWYDKTFFLLFRGAGSCFWIWKFNCPLSLPPLSGITVCSKAQLVSSCCCVATCIVTKIFLFFFVASSGMCWRGLVPSSTKSLETFTFQGQPSFFSWFGESRRDGKALLALLSLAAPPLQCKKTFVGVWLW